MFLFYFVARRWSSQKAKLPDLQGHALYALWCHGRISVRRIWGTDGWTFCENTRAKRTASSSVRHSIKFLCFYCSFLKENPLNLTFSSLFPSTQYRMLHEHIENLMNPNRARKQLQDIIIIQGLSLNRVRVVLYNCGVSILNVVCVLVPEAMFRGHVRMWDIVSMAILNSTSIEKA